MSNVLPPASLREVRRMNTERLLLVGSLLLIVCAAIAFLVLVPSYAIVRAESDLPEVSHESISIADKAERDDIFRAQLLVRDLWPIASSSTPILEVLNEVLRERPVDVVVRRINYERGNPGTIILSGSAPSREKIQAYQGALARNPSIKSANVPLQNLAGSDGGHFTLTLTGKF